MVQLLAIDNTGNYTFLDLNDDVSIPYNKSIEDIEDITARKGGYTKTFNIPGSDRNDRFFRSAFEVNATDFNSTLQTGCVIQYNGADVFNGTMRLNKITSQNGLRNYEVYLVETLTPFASELEQVSICDLDFSDIQHEINYDNITSTWDYSGGTYTSYSGLTGKVLYPLAQTGYDENTTVGLWDFTNSGFTSPTGVALQTTQFKPWINVKYLMDKVFEKAGFTYESNFFDTQYFQSIFMLAGNSPTMGALLLEDRPDNQNFFEVAQSSPYTYNYLELNGGWKYIIFQDANYDYLDNYTLSTFPAVPGQTGAKNYFTVPQTGTYQFNFDIRYWATYFAAPSYIDFALRDIDTGSNLGVYSAYPVVSTANDINLYFNVNLTKGQRVALFVQSNTPQSNDVAFNLGTFRLYSSPTISTTGATMNWGDNLSCGVSSVEFVRNIVNYFNLVFVPSGEKSFLIEPYKDYLSSLSGQTRDWSQKLNLNDTYTVEPLDFSLQRQLNLTFQDDTSSLGKYYIDNFNNIFGQKRYISTNPLLTGTQDIEFIFQSLPTNTVDNAQDCDFVVPKLYENTPEAAITQTPFSSEPRLGFYAGMKIPYLTGSTVTWYLQSGTTAVSQTKYPVISHLSQLTYDQEISDLNFTSNWDFFMDKNTMIGYTSNNAWNEFYKLPIELLYSEEARLFTGYFYLTPEDLKDIQFNDKIYFQNAEWRLIQIEDGDITEPTIVKCKFLKVPYRVPTTTPVPPDYVAQQTPKPTPTPTPTNTLNWYVANNLGSFAPNITSILFTVTQGTTTYLTATGVGSGAVSIPADYTTYNFYVGYDNVVGSMNNLRLCLGVNPTDCSLAQVDIPQPQSQTSYIAQATIYVPASTNIYAHIETY